MPRCVKCGRDMEKLENGFCSQACSNLDLQERIDAAVRKDDSHTRNLTG